MNSTDTILCMSCIEDNGAKDDYFEYESRLVFFWLNQTALAEQTDKASDEISKTNLR